MGGRQASAVHPVTYARCLRRRLRPCRPWAIAPGMAGSYVPSLRGADSRSAAARLRVLLATVPRDHPALQCQRYEGDRATPRRSRTAARTGLTERRRGPQGCRTDLEANQTIPGELRTIPEELQTIPEELQTIPEELQTIPEELQTIPEEIRTIPEEPRTIPGEPRTIPGEIRTIPREIRTTPGGIRTIPEELLTTPAEVQRILGPESRRAVGIPPIRPSAAP